MKSDNNKRKIVIEYKIFNKYLIEEIKEDDEIKLVNMLIKKFEKNNYIVYRENETYIEDNITKKVKKGTAVAIKKC